MLQNENKQIQSKSVSYSSKEEKRVVSNGMQIEYLDNLKFWTVVEWFEIEEFSERIRKGRVALMEWHGYEYLTTKISHILSKSVSFLFPKVYKCQEYQ